MLQVKAIDPAWPVVPPKGGAGPKPTKIHVNPHFVGKVRRLLFTINCKIFTHVKQMTNRCLLK